MNEALLLIGPTGAGKTPLGECIERRGLGGRRCAHFDFGHNLRRAAAGEVASQLLGEDDVAFIGKVLTSGALLEDEHFHIAEKILRGALAEAKVGDGDIVILNGLPRHVGQARDVDAILHVETVVQLVCSPETVLARIVSDAGGDRVDRIDDDVDAVRNKLAIFAARTEPLIDHYRLAGARVERIDVGVETSAEDAWRAVNERLGGC